MTLEFRKSYRTSTGRNFNWDSTTTTTFSNFFASCGGYRALIRFNFPRVLLENYDISYPRLRKLLAQIRAPTQPSSELSISTASDPPAALRDQFETYSNQWDRHEQAAGKSVNLMAADALTCRVWEKHFKNAVPTN
jgi:hypothetical protein